MSTLEKDKKQNPIKKFWRYLQKDTWDSWLVSLVLILILIRFVFFPLLSLTLGTSLPLVVVESCSMYHSSNFDTWWNQNSEYYESANIQKEDFEDFPLKNGLNKGDIVLIWGHSKPKIGDIIVFTAGTPNPLIHRIIGETPYETKGDHNTGQLEVETSIPEEAIIGKSVAKVPYIGWLKLIFFEPLRHPSQRGLCS